MARFLRWTQHWLPQDSADDGGELHGVAMGEEDIGSVTVKVMGGNGSCWPCSTCNVDV